MWKLSIDMAERNGALLRRLLRSAERLRESATARGLRLVKTPCSRSSALLLRMTSADQRRAVPMPGCEQSLCRSLGAVVNGMPVARSTGTMSPSEIKDFWRGYCQRRKVSGELIARGEKKIDEDPEHWADRTMDELLALVSDPSHKRAAGDR